MSIFFRNFEDAVEHYKCEHDLDFDLVRTAQRFADDNSRGYDATYDAAALLHNVCYFRDMNAMLAFFEKPWHYVEDVWAAVFTEAGVDSDECPDCD